MRGNRQADTKTYIAKCFSESHLDKIVQDQLLDLALMNVKCNNLIENKQRNLNKFLKAKNNNQDLPLIPRSASNFTLNGTEAIRDTTKFGMLQKRCQEIRENYNKQICDLCFSVGYWKRRL